jgi:uncharacterized protein (DUF427 family)
MVQAVWNGKVIAQSEKTVQVEGNHYFPSNSVNKEFLKPSSHTTVCGWKGTASYKNIQVEGKTNENAVWCYESPKPAASNIAGYYAFWKGVQVK